MITQVIQRRGGFGAGAGGLQILDGLIFQLLHHFHVMQVVGNLLVGLLELDSRTDERDQLLDGQARLGRSGQAESRHQTKDTPHIFIVAQVPSDNRRASAAFSCGYSNWKPADCAARGSTRWLARTTVDISPNMRLRANFGTGKMAGRCRVAASALGNSAFVTGF